MPPKSSTVTTVLLNSSAAEPVLYWSAQALGSDVIRMNYFTDPGSENSPCGSRKLILIFFPKICIPNTRKKRNYKHKKKIIKM